MPFSMLDSWHPEDLWGWMDTQRKAGNELLAISHNANLSDGWMYPTDVDSLGRPIDAAWAASRERNERLIEIKQIKGQSETHPLLSPNDEFSNYEIMSILLGLPDESGRIPHIVGSYARQALKDGLTLQDVRGFNPYKFGFGAASDSHNTASPYRQDNFFGGHASADGMIQQRMSGHIFNGIDTRLENPAGLTGAWAEQNTRASIWDAMYRKETFGTSGPRIKVRFFGGWTFNDASINASDWIKGAYKTGVPMGSDLPPMKGTAPTFAVWAMKDPTSGNLDRIQIVKGWSKNGQSFEKIYDVVWSGDRKADKWTHEIPAIASTVDIDTGTYTNSVGSPELKTIWTDPDFDASLHAFYYARVLEIPTPRWTTIQAHEMGIVPPDTVPATVQERAWASPIWYTPAASALKSAPAGTTVASLTAKGAAALTDAELKTLLVGKAMWIRNTVTKRRDEGALRRDRQCGSALCRRPRVAAERHGRPVGNLVSHGAGAVLDRQRQSRHDVRQHAARNDPVQSGRQVHRARAATSSATRTTNTPCKVPPICSISVKPRRTFRRTRHPSCMRRSEPAAPEQKEPARDPNRHHYAATGRPIGRDASHQAHCVRAARSFPADRRRVVRGERLPPAQRR
jgi:hypothetical protein